MSDELAARRSRRDASGDGGPRPYLRCPRCGGEWLRLTGAVLVDAATLRVTGWQGCIACPDCGVDVLDTDGYLPPP